MKVRWIALVVALLACEGQASAREESEASAKAEAKARFIAGQSHYNLNEFAEALLEFKEAYRLLPDPVFLYNLGQCERQLGHWDEAVRFYRSFLREQPKAPNRQEVLHKIEEIETFVKSKAGEPEKAEAAGDEATSAASPVPPAAAVEPAPPKPEPPPSPEPAPSPQTKSEPLSATPSLAASDSVGSAHTDLTAAPAAPAVADPPHWYSRWWVWAGTAAIVAGAGVAIVAATSSHGASAPDSTLGTKAVF